MRSDDVIADWARERSAAEVPPGFADRALAAALGDRRARWVRRAFVAAAIVAGAARVAAAFALFWTS